VKQKPCRNRKQLIAEELVAFLDTVVNGELHFALTPGERTIGVADVNAAFRDKPVAKHDNDILQRRAGVILLGHAIDRDLPAFHAIRLDVHNKNFLVSGNPVCRDPEGFAFVFEFPYHVVSSNPVVSVGVAKALLTPALKRGPLRIRGQAPSTGRRKALGKDKMSAPRAPSFASDQTGRHFA
jgi:hypothetical protein